MALVDRVDPRARRRGAVGRALDARARLRGVARRDQRAGHDGRWRRRRALYGDLRPRRARSRRGSTRCPPLAEWRALAKVGVPRVRRRLRSASAASRASSDGSLGSSTREDVRAVHRRAGQQRPADGRDAPVEAAARATSPGRTRRGCQVAVHAIGDRANAIVLDIFEAIAQANGPRDRRFRIEHAQHLRPEDFERFARARRDRVDAAVPRHRRRPLGRGAHRPRAGRSRPTPSARCSTPGRGWRSAPTGPSPRSTRCWASTPRSTARTLDGKHPGGWFPEQKITRRRGDRGLHARLGVRGVPGEGEGHAGGRQAGGRRRC